MDDQKHVRLGIDFRDAIRHRIFVYRAIPTIPVTRMDLLVLKNNPCAPVESVSQPRRPRHPHALDFRAPSGLQHFVQIQAHANIDILRQQRKRGVSRIIESPRLDANRLHRRAVLEQEVLRAVRRASIRDEDQVRIGRRVAEALSEFILIQSDGINADFHQ